MALLAGVGAMASESVKNDVKQNDMEALKMNIPDESYRSNFIGLTKELAPDGKEVSMFGITTFNNGHINPVPIQRDKKSISDTIMSELESSLDEKGKKKKISIDKR